MLVVSLIYVVFFGPAQDYARSLISPRVINISASDKVSVKPDIATLSFSVVTENVSVVAVQEDNNAKINDAISKIKALGVSDDDIKTVEYNLSPVYTQMSSYGVANFVPKIAKYSLTQTVSVKIRDFSKISPIFDIIASAGINKIGNISFSIDDPEQAYAQAREKAFAKVQEKANNMSKLGGIKIGRVVNISDYSSNSSIYRESFGGYGGDMVSAAPKIAADIQPGTQEVSVTVNVTYEIK